MIDIDTEGSKRLEIVELIKKEFGEENVLNMGTFTTEKSRSTVLTACRGLDIDKDIAMNIANLIPKEKAENWPIRDCLFGNEEEKRKPVREFIAEVDSHEGLRDALLSIEGLISGRSQHASGIVIFPDGYIEQNAMMQTTKGLAVTQFDAKDTEQLGGLKLDFLSVDALGRIREAMALLEEYGKIEWQGSLRATYEKYLHPDVLEMKDPKMYEMLAKGEVFNAFQFETNVGISALNKIKPQSFDELSAGNSLMRLTTSGKQPIDKYVEFKHDINLWYNEMDENKLTEDEKNVLIHHLQDGYGICDTQEGLMEISMDPKISGFSLTQANKFRKAVAKQNKELIMEQKELFFEQGKELGTSIFFLNYVWTYCLEPQFGYAFSKPHIAGYTLILMIEMNICLLFGSVFWKTACLSVNSGLSGDKETNTKYGKIAKAIGNIKNEILPPDINKSRPGFTPLEAENKILFGLKPIVGLGKDVVATIIENRPYESFENFIEKTSFDGSGISNKKIISLIKSGSFDAFEPDRRKLMIDFVKIAVPAKKKLTMANLPHVIEHLDKNEYAEELALYNFKIKAIGKKAVMTRDLEEEFIVKYKEHVEYTFKDGKLVIDEKSFKKFYEKGIARIKEWLAKPETAQILTAKSRREFWLEECVGSVEAWEMSTLLYYRDKHELDYYDLSNLYNISKFEDLPEVPVVREWKKWRGREIPNYQISSIAGTVVDKDKTKSLIFVLTQDGVVTVRYTKGTFAHYDKKVVQVNGKEKEVLDPSWFERGTLLILNGYRRDAEFVLNTRGSSFNHTTIKIIGQKNGEIYLQGEKVKLHNEE